MGEQAAFTTNYKITKGFRREKPCRFRPARLSNRVRGLSGQKTRWQSYKKARSTIAARIPLATPPAASSAQRFQPFVNAHLSAMALQSPARTAKDKNAPVFRALFTAFSRTGSK